MEWKITINPNNELEIFHIKVKDKLHDLHKKEHMIGTEA